MLFLLIGVALAAVFLYYSDCSFSLWYRIKLSSHTEEKHYRNKVVWIVGASSGIGEELALRLARFAPHLILSARRVENLQQVAAKCKEICPSCEVKVLPMDVTDLPNIEQKTKEANELFGKKVNIVVLNAGRTQRAEWTDIDPSIDAQIFTLNTIGPVQIARSLLKLQGLHPANKTRGDLQFVIVSSVAGLLPAVLSASYAASKAAINSHFRMLAAEMGEKGVKVNIICPSLVFAPNLFNNAFTAVEGQVNGEVLSQPTARHMPVERAAELISLATVHDVLETVISQTSLVLFLTYAFAVAPGAVTKVMNIIGNERFRKIRLGKDD